MFKIMTVKPGMKTTKGLSSKVSKQALGWGRGVMNFRSA